jgi:acetylornithine deacetylase
LGFAVEVVEVEPGKFNMLAKKGQGEGGLLLAGHTVILSPLIKGAGVSTHINSPRKTTSFTASAPPI